MAEIRRREDELTDEELRELTTAASEVENFDFDEAEKLEGSPGIHSGDLSQRMSTQQTHEAKKDFVKAAATEVAANAALGGAGKVAQAAIAFIPAPKEFARHGISKISAAIPEAAKKKFLAALDRLREVDQPEYMFAIEEYNSIANKWHRKPEWAGPGVVNAYTSSGALHPRSGSLRLLHAEPRQDPSRGFTHYESIEPEKAFNQHLRTIDHIGEKSGLHPPKQAWQDRLHHTASRIQNNIDSFVGEAWPTTPDYNPLPRHLRRTDYSSFPSRQQQEISGMNPGDRVPVRARVLDEDIVQIPLVGSRYNDPAPPGSLSMPEGSPGALSMPEGSPGALSIVDDIVDDIPVSDPQGFPMSILDAFKKALGVE